jgi:hypothetical protein
MSSKSILSHLHCQQRCCNCFWQQSLAACVCSLCAQLAQLQLQCCMHTHALEQCCCLVTAPTAVVSPCHSILSCLCALHTTAQQAAELELQRQCVCQFEPSYTPCTRTDTQVGFFTVILRKLLCVQVAPCSAVVGMHSVKLVLLC